MLYAFGSNGSGQLGVGHNDDLSTPSAITVAGSRPIDWTVLQLAAGGNHTVILCSDGKVRAAGNNEDGRCGLSVRKQYLSFEEVDLPLNENNVHIQVSQISATWSASFILSSTSTVFVCGSGSGGELGLGDGISVAPLWRQITIEVPRDETLLSLISNMAHTIALISTGDVYGWGKGRKGQLGEPYGNIWAPRQVDQVSFKAEKVVCGKDFTYIVSAPSSDTSVLLGLHGNDRFGVISGASRSSKGWSDVHASWGSIFVLRESGLMHSWGRDDHGQLHPPDLPEISAIAAGSEHCLALSQAGDVLAWGWGEHGNCGRITTGGDVRGRYNQLATPGIAKRIYAGCATSFFESVP